MSASRRFNEVQSSSRESIGKSAGLSSAVSPTLFTSFRQPEGSLSPAEGERAG